tara:strand:- start:80 stop:676 length:597 start_codon:yes stop_codon:yes gene_type:complete
MLENAATPPEPTPKPKLIEVTDDGGGKYSARVIKCEGGAAQGLTSSEFDKTKGNDEPQNPTPTGAKSDTNAEFEENIAKLEDLDGDLFKKLKEANDREKLQLLTEALRQFPTVLFFPNTIKESTKLLIGRLEAEDAKKGESQVNNGTGEKVLWDPTRRKVVGGKRSRALRSKARRSRAGGKRSRARRTKSKRSKSRRR